MICLLQIDVEGPSPGCSGTCETTSNHWSENGTETPGKSSQSKVYRTFFECCENGKVSEIARREACQSFVLGLKGWPRLTQYKHQHHQDQQ